MNIHQAKKDVHARLNDLPYDKLTAKTISFSGLGYGDAIFVKIHGLVYEKNGNHLKDTRFADLPKPTEGGYVLDFENCKWYQNKP